MNVFVTRRHFSDVPDRVVHARNIDDVVAKAYPGAKVTGLDEFEWEGDGYYCDDMSGFVTL